MKTTDTKTDSNISTNSKGYLCSTRVPLVVRVFFASLVTASCSLSTLYAVTVPTMPSNQGLIGYWKFDEGRTDKTRDYSGNGNTGTLTSFADPATATSGWKTSAKMNGGIVFDGVDDNVSFEDVLNVSLPITFSLWINPSSIGSYQGLVTNDKSGNAVHSGAFMLLTPSGGIELHYGDNTTCDSTGRRTYVTSSSPIAVNGWYHIVGIIRGPTDMSIYVNGMSISGTYSGTGGSIASRSDSGPRIGAVGICPSGSASYIFNGTIDEVRMYNRALSASEVAALAMTPAVSKQVSTAGSNLSSGLVGHWTFNGKDVSWGGTTGTTTIRDISGNGYHGGIYGIGANSLASGKGGQALTLNGVNTKGVLLGTDSSLNPSTFTISGWVKTSSSTYAYNYIYSNSRDCCGSPYYGIDFYVSASGRLQGGVWDGATKSSVLTGTSVIPPNVWAYVTFSFDGTLLKMYKNGTLLATSTSAVGVGSPASFPTYLGSMGNAYGSQYTLGGQLDDVRLYSRALSDADVMSLYRLSGGTTKTSVSPTSVASGSGLVGHWTFDGNKLTSTTATDSSGLGNNGSVVGSVPSPTIGKLGQALLLNSATTTGAVSAGNPASLQINSGTLSAWIKTGNAGTGYRGIVGKSVAYGMYLQSNIFGLYDPTAGVFRTTGVNLADNRWHHVVASFDSGVTGGVSLYIDGTLRATSTMTIVNQGSNVQVGIGQGGPTQVFSGAIDDPRVYNRILSASEVYNLYRAGTR